MSELLNGKDKDFFKIFKEDDDSIKLNDTLFSSASVNNFIGHNSSARGLMLSSHAAQTIVLEKPDSKIIQSGYEKEMVKSLISKEIENTSEVISVVKRYTSITGDMSNKNVSTFIIYREIESEEVGVLEIPIYNKLHPYFGFKFIIDDMVENLMAGDIIEGGTILAYPPTYNKERDSYGFGKNINVALMSLDETAEDGIIISDKVAEDLSYHLYEEVSVSVGKDSFLLNIYGDDDEYKPFPDIGEKVLPSGMVVASRKFDPLFAPGLMSTKDLQIPNTVFDNCVYCKGEGTIVDIKAYYSNQKKKMLPKDTDTEVIKYSNSYLKFSEEIVRVYDRLNKNYSSATGNQLLVSEEFTRLYVESKNLLISSTPTSRIHKQYRKQRLDLYKVEFVIEHKMHPIVGSKQTDLSGGKGISVIVRPEAEMPVDGNGVRAGLVMDPNSTVSRLNIGRLYERYFGGSSRRVKALVTEEVCKVLKLNKVTGKDISSLKDSDVKRIFTDYPLAFTKLLENKQYGIYKKGTVVEMRGVLSEIIDHEMYLYFSIGNEKRAYEVVMDIEETIFKPLYGPVTYIDSNKEFTTVDNIMIAPMHILLLNKIADGLLSTSSSSLNHFGLSIGPTASNRHRLPWRNSAVRFIGETEARLYGGYGGREMLAELIDRGASTASHAKIYSKILKEDKPMNIPVLIDREKEGYGEHKALEILTTLFNSVGLDITHKEDESRYYDKVSTDLEGDSVSINLDNVEITEETIDKREEE